jgi:UDP:flavonoid glycosyltransferase YjiC (YdhE family)
MEAVWHAVPQVALPVYGDQLDVANLLVHRGVALLLPQLKNANADQIHKTLTVVLNDPRYKK